MTAKKEEEAEAKINSEKKGGATNVEAEATSSETVTEEGDRGREAAAAEDPIEEEDPDPLQDLVEALMSQEGDTIEVTERDILIEEEGDQKAAAIIAEATVVGNLEVQVPRRVLEVNQRRSMHRREETQDLCPQRSLSQRIVNIIQKAAYQFCKNEYIDINSFN